MAWAPKSILRFCFKCLAVVEVEVVLGVWVVVRLLVVWVVVAGGRRDSRGVSTLDRGDEGKELIRLLPLVWRFFSFFFGRRPYLLHLVRSFRKRASSERLHVWVIITTFLLPYFLVHLDIPGFDLPSKTASGFLHRIASFMFNHLVLLLLFSRPQHETATTERKSSQVFVRLFASGPGASSRSSV